MKFKLDLIQNSYDYLISSLDFFIVADENGMPDEQKSDIERKVRWKLAYVS